MATVDIVIVVLYVLGNLGVGVYFARKQAGLTSYFLGDRNVAWWLILASIVTTETSTVTFLSVPGKSFAEGGNLTFLQLAIGYVFGRAVIAWLLLPQYFKGEILSAYQVLRQKFDVRVQRVASGLFLMTRTVADGLRLFLTAKLLHLFTGWDAVHAVLVLAAITAVYTYLGGMHAVMWTDLIQFTVKIGGALLAVAMIYAAAPGGWAGVSEEASAVGKLTLFDFAFNLQSVNVFWTGAVGGAVLTMATHGADQMMVQRYLCGKSLNEARLALVLSGVVILGQFLLFLLIGLGLWALQSHGLLGMPRGYWVDGVFRPYGADDAFGYYIVNRLPIGLCGLVVAAVLAAAMSTLSASLNSSATAFVVDFYKPLRAGKDESHYLNVSRLMTLVWGAAQVTVALVALTFRTPASVVDSVLSVAGWSSGIVLGLFVLGGFRRPVASSSALVGLVAGAGAVTAVYYTEALAYPWYALVGASTTVAVGLLVDAIRPREPEA